MLLTSPIWVRGMWPFNASIAWLAAATLFILTRAPAPLTSSPRCRMRHSWTVPNGPNNSFKSCTGRRAPCYNFGPTAPAVQVSTGIELAKHPLVNKLHFRCSVAGWVWYLLCPGSGHLSDINVVTRCLRSTCATKKWGLIVDSYMNS